MGATLKRSGARAVLSTAAGRTEGAGSEATLKLSGACAVLSTASGRTEDAGGDDAVVLHGETAAPASKLEKMRKTKLIGQLHSDIPSMCAASSKPTLQDSEGALRGRCDAGSG